jgi:ATP-dependent Lon protease
MTETRALESSHPVLPVRGLVLLPELVISLSVGRARSIAAVEAALQTEEKTLVVVTQRSADVAEPALADLHEIGCLAAVRRMERGEGKLSLFVQGLERVRLLQAEPEAAYLRCRVQRMPPPDDSGPEVEASQRRLRELAAELVALLEAPAAIGLAQMAEAAKEPLHQVYILAPLVSLDAEQLLALLKTNTRLEALQAMLGHLEHELQVAKLQKKIEKRTQKELSRQEKEHILRQQLQAIQKELGCKSPEQAEMAELKQRLEAAELPEEVAKEVAQEIELLGRKSAEAADYQLARSYIELALELPWTRTTEDLLDLVAARRVLDEDHYDLEDVKQRILEHLAVMQLNPAAKAPILCFVGPPGVGKTSLGQSIARALGRKFARLSLGGLHDEAELRGHRRTYIGAMPGRILQAIRRAGVKNPLLMLDEVDKLGRDFRGDPAAALMEILDPAQNARFHDNYLNLPFDLSKVFFITTANTLDSIPRPLLDRMELLRLAGYSEEEKAAIARRYLFARQLAEAGITAEQLTLTDAALAAVIREYTREAGVRELERMLGRLCRKAATRIVAEPATKLAIDPEALAQLLGPPRFHEERQRLKALPGVATALAWTEAGGEVMYVEAVLLPEGQGLRLTGQLGDVMKESATTAQSWVWSRAEELGLDKALIQKAGVHIHVPAGAVPKDGPSAGIAMATALASLYSGSPARADTAMTGEVTLSGLVLPIGGVKEKVLAARRARLARVVLPRDNERDLADLPPDVKSDLEFVFVESLGEALEETIPLLAERTSATGAAPPDAGPEPRPSRSGAGRRAK